MLYIFGSTVNPVSYSSNYKFELTATATDLGENSLSTVICADIRVVESYKKLLYLDQQNQLDFRRILAILMPASFV